MPVRPEDSVSKIARPVGRAVSYPQSWDVNETFFVGFVGANILFDADGNPIQFADGGFIETVD